MSKSKSSITIPQAMIIGSLIGLVSPITTSWIQEKFDSDPSSQNSKDAVDGESTPGVKKSTKGFGQWSDTKFIPGVRYLAGSDGFISVYTSGNHPPDGVEIDTGADAETLKRCTRIDGRYAGGICPVKEGDMWLVISRGSAKGITIKWMPVST